MIVSFFELNGQNQNKYTYDSDTSFWLRYQTSIFEKIRDIKPINLNNKYHFRMIFLGQVTSNVFDIWSDDGRNYNSELVIFTKEYIPFPEEQTNRYYYEKKTFDNSFSNDIIDIIDKSQIENLPTDSLIKGWHQGFDGVEYILETIKNGYHSYKQY